MKKIALFIIITTLTTTIGCTQDAGADNAGKQGPKIEFEKTIHDFGDIEYGGNGTYEFVFKNTGNEPLIITDVKSSCGCTVPKWSKEPIPKGESGTIKVKYNTRRAGSFTKSVRVLNNSATPQVVLQIKGKVGAPPPPEN